MKREGRRGRGGGRGGLAGDEEHPPREQAWLANGGRGGQGTGSIAVAMEDLAGEGRIDGKTVKR